MKRLLAFLFVLIILSAFNCAEATEASEETIKVGAIYPLSGSLSPIGTNCKNAIELAAMIVNNSYDIDLPLAKNAGLQGLGDAKVEVIFGDSQGLPINGKAEAERLINQQNVVGIVGCFQSAVAVTISLECERGEVPFVVADASASTLANPRYKYFFRTGHTDQSTSDVQLTFLNELNKLGTGLETIALIFENSESGKNQSILLEEKIKKTDFDIVENLTFATGITDVTSEVQRIKRADPDAIIQGSYVSDAILFTKTYKSQNYSPKILITDEGGFAASQYLDTLGDVGNYVMVVSSWNIDLLNINKLAKEVNDLYYKQYGKNMDSINARSFVGALVMFMAIDKAGSADSSEIQKALLDIDIDRSQLIGVSGVKFDPETHENVRASLLVTQIIDEKYQIIWPFEFKIADYVFPIPEWSKR